MRFLDMCPGNDPPDDPPDTSGPNKDKDKPGESSGGE